MAKFVTVWDHYTMTISQWTWRTEGSLSVYFITYFAVILTKTYTLFASTSLLIICDKTAAEKRWFLPKIVFFISKQPFAIHSFLASRNVPPAAIPAIFAPTPGSDHWKLIHCLHSQLWKLPLLNNQFEIRDVKPVIDCKRGLWLKNFFYLSSFTFSQPNTCS